MQATPSDGSSSAQRLRRARIAWMLASLAFVSVLAALVLAASSFALGIAVNAANPTCVTASGHLADMQTLLNSIWLAGGAAVVFAWVCGALAAWIARQGSPEAANAANAAGAARVALIFSVIALVGFALSFCRFEIVSFGQCIG